jgi:quercetin dioxygenase-like cupin family protein
MTATGSNPHLGALYHVARLRAGGGGGEVDAEILARVFGAPWQTVALIDLAPGKTFGERDLDESEAMVFISAGTGVAQLGHGAVDLREGISLTLFKGERLELRASAGESLEFFFVEIRERPAGQAAT